LQAKTFKNPQSNKQSDQISSLISHFGHPKMKVGIELMKDGSIILYTETNKVDLYYDASVIEGICKVNGYFKAIFIQY
jgi:hypothetical protein